MQYLLKVTVTWTLFLLIYELLYKNSGRYLINRVYLLLSLLVGLVLPFIKLPVSMMGSRVANVLNITATGNNVITATNGEAAPVAAFDWAMIAWWGYGIVAAVLLGSTLLDVVYILRHAIYGRFQQREGHKIFSIDKPVPPYSFMGWIFVSSNHNYSDAELAYVTRHEAAHNRQRHWIDNLVLQLLCVVLWFHPLVWRFRYLLKMQHEYEADHMASGGDAYSYGHFLLAQTLMKGVPSIAHSFHFSPIKNRINMLTKNQSSGLKKYLLMVPVLVLSVMVMATAADKGERKREGNMTYYKGNAFEWEKETPGDTIIIEDPATGKERTMIQHRNPAIVRFNKEAVINGAEASVAPQFKSANNIFGEYIKRQLEEDKVTIPENISQIGVVNIVLNKKGKIVYYDLQFFSTTLTVMPRDYDPVLSPIVDKIIGSSPTWQPASKDGRECSVFIGFDPKNSVGFRAATATGIELKRKK